MKGAESPDGAVWGEFASTRWSAVLAAGREGSEWCAEALNWLCQAYWHPVYVYIRRHGRNDADARDLTQEFFARLLSRQGLGHADPSRGRFRAFLLASVRHFLMDAWDRERAIKRQATRLTIPFDELERWERWALPAAGPETPDVAFERHWARSVLHHACEQLREDYVAAGRGDRFAAFTQFLPDGSGDLTYAEIGRHLGLTEAAVRSEVHRLRERFRAVLRRVIAHTVATPEEIDDEIRHLMKVLTG